MAKGTNNLTVGEVTGTVTLELSGREAVVLTKILRSVGGDPRDSFRKEAANILEYGLGEFDAVFEEGNFDSGKDGAITFRTLTSEDEANVKIILNKVSRI